MSTIFAAGYHVMAQATSDDPHAKRKSTNALSMPKSPKARHGLPQQRFIDNARKRIDKDLTFFENNKWSRIEHGYDRSASLVNKKKIDVDSFCVKALTVWLPHVPNCVPTCAKSNCKTSVDVNRTRWVENPKTSCGIGTHRCFDTKHHWCSHCNGDFAAWHPDALKHDASEITGMLNFRLSRGFAVDEDLCSFMVTHNSDTTASIHDRLKKMLADGWINDATFCHRAVLANQVKNQEANVGDGQTTLDSVLVPRTEAMKRFRSDRHQLVCLQRELRSVESSFNADVEFAKTFDQKKNRNSTGLPFRGIGKEKCLTLMQRGILAAKDSLNCDGCDPATKGSWKDVVQAHCDNLSHQVAALRSRISKLEIDVAIEDSIREVEDEALAENARSRQQAPRPPPPKEKKAPPFSSLNVRNQFNGRVISKATIDRIKSTDCQLRKSMQLAKMRSIIAKAWKIDWGYKLAPKIKVCTGRGKPFAPFNSIATVQNEDSLTLFWKCYPCSEGIDVMKDDLLRLKKHNNLLGEEVAVAWVDNCCIV